MAQIKLGDFIVDNPDVASGETSKKDNKKNSDKGGFAEKTGRHELVAPELEPNQKLKTQSRRNIDKILKSRKTYKSKIDLGKGGNKTEVSANWERAKRSALASGGAGLTAKAKKLLIQITSNKPKVNWKKELKKFMDLSFNSYDYKIPNKRMLARGDILYGRRKAGVGTLKTLVLPVDTSGSITKEMISVFYEEVWRLSTMYEIDEIIIIYASDQVDNIDRVKRGKKPDLTKWATTGGNAGGFHHPFKWMQKNKIKPSAVIYFTDTGGEFPTSTQYGIDKYKNKVFWFIVGEHHNKPPFGSSIVVKMDMHGKIT